ncbi:MAG: hypothetical protein ACMXYE_05510, partial [Candidatus Woesearchaeota archaeon]
MSKQLSLRNAIVHTLLCVFFIFVVATLSSEASAIDNLACEFPNPLVEQHGYSAECTWNIPEDEDTNESLYKVLNISFRTPGGISCYDMAESTQNLDSDDTSGNLHFTSIVVSQNTDCFWRVRLYADSTKTGNVEHFEIDGQSMIYDRLIGLGFSFVDAIVTPITSDEIPIINSRNVTIRARPIEPAESCFYVILNKSQSVSDYNHTDADYFSDNLASLNTDRLKHPDNTLQNILKAGQMTYFSSRDMFERELEFKNDYNEYEPPFLYYGVYCKHGAFSNPAVFGRELLRFGIDTTPPIIKNTSGGVNFTEPDPPGITFEFNEFSISSENQQIFLPSSSGDFVFTTNEPAICKYEFVDSASSQLTYNTLANTANTEFQTDFRVPFDVPIGRNRFLYLACEDEHGNKADSSNREYIFIAFNSSNPFTFFYKDPQPVEWVNTTPIPETQGNQIKVDWELSLNDPSSPLCTSDSMCYVTRYDIYRTDEITGDSVGENKSMFLYNLSENNITYLGYVPAGENTFTDTTAENELDYYYYVMARYYDPLNAGTIQFNSSAITRSNLVNTSDELAPKPVTDLRADLARNNIN